MGRRCIRKRLEDYLSLTILPQVASRLGPEWEARGGSLVRPGGLKLYAGPTFDDPSIMVVHPVFEEPRKLEEGERLDLTITVDPAVIAEAIRDRLLPGCATVVNEAAG